MSGTTETKPVDQQKMEAFLGKVLGDFGRAFGVALAYMGDRLGLYRALASGGPATPAELAERTGTVERYIREWLIQQAAGGYVEFDVDTGRYELPAEQATALTDETSPFFVGGGFETTLALLKAEPRIREAFQRGGGMLWGEHDPGLFSGTERFFRPAYLGHLAQEWLPALDGVVAKLEAGAKVADVGCGHGASTIIMGQAFPRSRFFGFDNHAPSIERASQAAKEAGIGDRVTFAVADSGGFPGEGYDLIAFCDCFHDLGDPAGAARRAFETLAADGTVMIVEPMAGERVEENFNPLGRIFAGASVLCCTPNSLACGGPGLGTIATDDRLGEMVAAGGFTRFRRATQTPFNRVFEARR